MSRSPLPRISQQLRVIGVPEVGPQGVAARLQTLEHHLDAAVLVDELSGEIARAPLGSPDSRDTAGAVTIATCNLGVAAGAASGGRFSDSSRIE